MGTRYENDFKTAPTRPRRGSSQSSSACIKSCNEKPLGNLAAILLFTLLVLAPRSVGQNLEVSDIAFVDDAHGWVLMRGEGSTIFRTTNGGQTWTQFPIPFKNGFFRLYFFDRQTGIALQLQPKEVTAIYRTENAGESWIEVNTIEMKNHEQFVDLYLVNQREGFVVGEGEVGRGVVVQLLEEGRKSRRRDDLPVDFAGQSNALAVFGDGTGHIWIVGKKLILHSADFGKTWENQFINSEPRIDMGMAGAALPGGHARIAVANFNIYKTEDYGRHWTKALTTVDKDMMNFESISFPNIRQGCAVGNSSFIYCTEDCGLNWSEKNVFNTFPNGAPFFSKLLLFNTSRGWASIAGGLYKTEDGGHSFREMLTSSGTTESSVPGETKALETSINGPAHLAYDTEGYLYIIEAVQHRLLRLDLKNESIKVLTSEPKHMDFGYPNAVIPDQHGIVYIADFDGQLRKLDTRTGDISVLLARPVRLIESQLENPEGMAIDKDGNVLIASSQRHRVLRWQVVEGKLEIVAGSRPGFGGDGGIATSAMLHFPMGVTIDPAGDVFVSDYESCRIRKIEHGTNTINTIAGTGECATKGDNGPAINASLNYPSSIVSDNAGNLFFVEGATDRVRRIDKYGLITTYAGTGQKGFGGDGGPADQALLDNPSGLAVDPDGNIYISEFVNNRVRRVDAITHVIMTVAGNGKPYRVDAVM